MLRVPPPLLLALLGFAGLAQPAPARPPLDKPNVIVIFLDDSGYGDYEHTGNPVIQTPNIARLAAQGANFTQFYVASSACSASRYALMTGRYPSRSQLGGWVIGPESKQHLRPQETTLAEGLKQAGYRTAMFGKWHLGNPNPENGMTATSLPLAHGFESWIGTNVSHDYGNALLLKSDPAGKDPIPEYATLARKLPANPAVCESLTGQYTEGVVAFIEANKDRPFFAYVAHNQPHLGLFASAAYKGKSRRGLLGDVMAEIDGSVGRIMAAVENAGIANNTMIIFSSDNGPWIMFQDAKQSRYGEARLHVGYAQPFRDGKGSTWEGGYRVPGIFHWPGVIPPARQLEPASTLDLLPTLFALAGAHPAPDRKIDGRDIRPLLAPDKFPGTIPEFSFLYHYSKNEPVAIRKGPWKLMIAQGSQTGNDHGFKASEATPLLFQLENDLGERIDRAADFPAITAELKSLLLARRDAHAAETAAESATAD